MTDRLQQLEAVAKAAFDYRHLITTETHRALVRAVDALAAHDAQPAAVVGEMVEVWGSIRTNSKGVVGGRICSDEKSARHHADRVGDTENGRVLGFVFRLRVPLASTPEITATVEPGA